MSMISTGKRGGNTWDIEFCDETGFPETVHELRRTPQGRKVLVDQGVSMKGYKRGRGEYSSIPFTERRFVSWDGEGDPDKTTYFLYGNSDGEHIHAPSLGTAQILAFMVEKASIDAIHIGFAYGYDVNMTLKDLSKNHLRILNEKGKVRWGRWYIQHTPRKWFSVTDRHTHRTVKIWDVWSFFMTSAIKAWEQYGVDISDVVRKGKEERGKGYEDLEEVIQYWREENDAYVQLVTRLRESLHAAELFISAWHGPGAIASYSMRKYHIDRAMAPSPHAVGLASQYGYGGGRFEMFKVGRANTTVYEYDINSAYPYAIAQLPDLARGKWVHRVGSPQRIARFAIYRISFRANPMQKVNLLRPMPFLHRDPRGLISFPCVNDTWIWSPELWGKEGFPGLEIHEGWEFIEDSDARPFAWLAENYEIRKAYKDAGNPAQLALKLQMNSMYGKMAQRVGWNEKTFKAPKWHQLEWAGWVTAYCRSMVFRAALLLGNSLVAFETDAVFGTKSIAESLHIGKGLGDWEETVYDDFVYLQSGCRFGLRNGEWKEKYRGFDAGSLKLDDALQALSLDPEHWAIQGTTKRFIGYAQAIHQNFDMWRMFETDKERVLTIGGEGKRRHNPKICRACRDGVPASETFHDCSSARPIPKEIQSTKHYLPWKDGELLESQILSDEYKQEVMIA